MNYDLVIRGGSVVDGTRLPRFNADVGIKDGRVAKIGRIDDVGDARLLDADGCIVAPGFMDLHTHYDAQIHWDPYCTISGWHGVTSVALGNCGFGFAPVRPADRDRSMLLMTRTEQIPFETMKEGMPWAWETFPEWLDNLQRIPKGVNVIAYVPVNPLLIYVMGSIEEAKSRTCTREEQKEMQRLLNEAMDHGALGFSIQRLGENSVQADYDGTPMPTDTMCDEDVLALGEVLAERDEGFIQITQFTGDLPKDLAFQERLAEVSGRPILHNIVAVSREKPEIHRNRLEWLDGANGKGLRIFGQGATIRTGFAFTLEHWNLYDSSPAWNRATTGTFDEKMAKFQDEEVRAAIRAETDAAIEKLGKTQALGGPIEQLLIQSVDDCPNAGDLERYVGKSVQQIADEQGKHPIDAMLDLAVEGNLKVEFLGRDRGQSADYMAEMITAPYSIPGVSDGGAHTKFFTGGAYTTDFLAWMVRDEKKLSLEEAHYRLSYLPAFAAGFRDRGFLREGAPADVVVYDLDALEVTPPWVGEVAHDFPANEWRRVQHAKGYRMILVNGVCTFEDGECTGNTPGQLLRHGRA